MEKEDAGRIWKDRQAGWMLNEEENKCSAPCGWGERGEMEPSCYRWIRDDLTAVTCDPCEGIMNQSEATVFLNQDTHAYSARNLMGFC